MKRTFTLWMVCLMTGYALAFDFKAGDIYYKVTGADEVAVTVGEKPYEGYVKMPETVDWQGQTYKITAIDKETFRNCSHLVGVGLPKGLKTIGEYAFFNCDDIYSISFPDGLETIGASAFYECDALSAVKIPASVTSIGTEAFLRCKSIASFSVADGNSTYSAPDGVLMDKGQTLLMAFPNGKGSGYTIPASVTAIGDMAFVGCGNLQVVVMPEHLLRIGDAAFYGCSQLQSVAIPSSVESIGEWAFTECAQLAAVTLGVGINTIGEGAFSFCPELQYISADAGNMNYCSVDGVLMTKDKQTIVACPGAKKGSFLIPTSVNKLQNTAFFGCHELTSVILPSSLADIGENPFVFCDGLKEILVNNEHPELTSDDGVLMNKERTAVIFYPNAKEGAYAIPNGVKALTNGTFVWSHSLTNLTVPKTVTSIGSWTFLGCEMLQSISIPASVTTIGDGAFLDCPSLSTIIYGGSPTPTAAFDDRNYTSVSLYVPKGMENQYRETTGWSSFTNINPFGIYVDHQSLKRGQWYNLPIYMAGPQQISSLQFDVVLPNGLEMAEDESGNYVVSTASESDSSVSCTKLSDERYRIALSSTSNVPLSQLMGEGEESSPLLYVGVRGNAETPEGILDMLLQDICLEFVYGVHDGEAYQPNQTAAINLQLFTGDVNRSGRLTVADAVEVYRYIANNPTSSFHFAEADINKSNEVNMTDAQQLIGMLQDESMTGLPEWYWNRTISTDILTAEDLVVAPGGNASLRLNLNNDVDNYTALQFKLLLPAGITIVTDGGGVPYQLSSRFTDSNQPFYITEMYNDERGAAYRVMSVSPSLSPISGNSGLLLTLSLTADDHASTGSFTGQLQDVVFAADDANESFLDNTSFNLKLSEQTAVMEVVSDSSKHDDIIYNLAGQRVNKLKQGIYIVNGKKKVIKP